MTDTKILVEITELDERVHFKKCPVNQAGQVKIYTKGGRGKKGESPKLPSLMFKQSTFFGLITKRYGRYRRGTNRFMNKDDSNIPSLSLELVQDIIDNDAFKSFFGDKTVKGIFYIIILLSAISVFFGVLPYIR